MGDGGQLTGVRGSGDSGHPETRQIRWNDLQALAKSLGYQNGNGELVGWRSLRWRHGWWFRAHRHGVLARYWMNRGHGEDEWLTKIRIEVVAASERLRWGGSTAVATSGERGKCG